MVKEIISDIINWGVQFESTFYEKRKVRLLNILYLISIVSAEFYCVIYSILSFKTLYPAIIGINLFILVNIYGMYLNKINKRNISGHLLCSSMTGIAIVNTFFILGTSTFVHFYFLLFALAPILVWKLKQILRILLYFSVNTAIFIYAHFFWNNSAISQIFPTQFILPISVITIVTTFVSLLAALWVNQNYIEDNERKLEHQSEDLKRFIDELYAQQNEIKRQSSELDFLNTELNHKNSALQELNSTKDRFFSIIAHDLKNPVSSLKGLADELNNKFDQLEIEETKDSIKWISDSSKHILLLLENLLEWSRSQINKTSFNPEPGRPALLVDNLLNLFRAQAQNKQIELISKIDSEITLLADMNLLNTVLRNLISNAIKFTPIYGKVTISCSRRGNFAEISVADTGVGMTGEVIDKLFKIDGIKSTPGTLGEKGTGLGLALCKEYVNMHGGELRVQSIEKQGSIFSFDIPLYSFDDRN